MTETNTDKFLEGFRQWWLNKGHSKRSADSYCSGIRRVNKEFFLPIVNKDLFDGLVDAVAKGCAENFLTALVGTIGEKSRNTTDPTEKKRLQDNVSHLKKFIEYVVALQDDTVAAIDHSETEQLDDSALDSDFEFFDHDTLAGIFSLRIKTQDRMSAGKNVFFPIRILGSLFSTADRYHLDMFIRKGIIASDGNPLYLKRWYDSWVKSIVGRVVFHTTKGDYRLSEIEGLRIMRSTGSVWIVDKEHSRTIPLLSEGENGLQPMKAKSLKQIHLDHTERMEDLLIRLEPVLTVMRQITDNIKASVKGQTVTVKDKRRNEHKIELDDFRPGTLTLVSGWYCDNVDWDFIAPLLSLVRVELDYIAAATRLTAMSSTDNLKKH